MDEMLSFCVTHRDPATGARAGLLRTAIGPVETPVFMPVGTAGAVKAMPHEWLEELGTAIILCNTYHLYLRPGHERIRSLGGLHRFMAWNGSILTDSGGYQVFSHRELRRIGEEGVWFQSHLDGSRHFLSPEIAVDIQNALGSDIAMVFDDCTPYPSAWPDAEESMERSMRWARRCKDHWEQSPARAGALFGIVQGSVYPDLRCRSAQRLLSIGFPGYAIGGLSVGEPKSALFETLDATVPLLPPDRPRYLMGVGTPRDLIRAVAAGVDMFDCVLPTRNARNGCLFTRHGRILIKNAAHAEDDRPVDQDCPCRTCRRFSRAYLRHLFMAGEHLSAILNTVHNLTFYLDLMRRMRESIKSGSFGEWLDFMEQCPE